MHIDPVLLEKVVTLAVLLLGLVPLAGGNAGALIAVVVDVLKAVRVVPDKWGGLVFLVLNLAGVIALNLGANVIPGGIIPEPLSGNLGLLVTIISTGLMLATSLWAGPKVHSKILVPLAPTAFSHTNRKQGTARPLAG